MRTARSSPPVIPIFLAAALLLPEAARADGPAPDAISATSPGGYTCVLGERAAMDPADAQTTVEVVCEAIASHHARPGAYDVRIGKLGAQLSLRVSERASTAERRLFIGGPEEVPQAADRIATALVESRTIADTQGVDNVVRSEVAAPLRKEAPLSFFIGGTTTQGVGVGYQSNMSLGAEGDVELRVRRFGVAFQGRAGGVSTGENFVGYWSLGVIGRYYLSDSDTSLFVGAGPAVAYYQANEQNMVEGYVGMGFEAAAEVGASFFRSSHAGMLVSLRADLPAFELGNSGYWDGPSGGPPMYLSAFSITFGLTFR